MKIPYVQSVYIDLCWIAFFSIVLKHASELSGLMFAIKILFQIITPWYLITVWLRHEDILAHVNERKLLCCGYGYGGCKQNVHQKHQVNFLGGFYAWISPQDR